MIPIEVLGLLPLSAEGRGPCSDETKQKISEANRGSKRTEEQKQKMREAALRRWNKNK